jgi:hypothetical protein
VDSNWRSACSIVTLLARLNSGWRPDTVAPMLVAPTREPVGLSVDGGGSVSLRVALPVRVALGRDSARTCSSRYCADSACARAAR